MIGKIFVLACPSILQFDLSSSTIIQVIDTFLCQVTNPTPSPDPLSRGMQPQHQPHTEQTLPNQISSPQQPLLQEPSNIQSSAGPLYNLSPGLPEHSHEAPQDQGEQLSHTYEESQLYNTNSTKNLPQSKSGPSVPEAITPTRYSNFQGNNAISTQNSFASSDEQDQTATVGDAAVGDAAPVFLHTTPTAEFYIDSPEAQRRDSNASSGRTPTQARFNRAGRSGRLSSTVSLDEQACLPKEQQSDPSFQPEHAGGPEDREDENQEDYDREISEPQSHEFAHKSLSAEMAHEREMERQAFDHTSKQRLSEPSDGMLHTVVNPAPPQGVLETEAHSETQPKDLFQGRPQEMVPRGGSPSQIDLLLPPSQLHSASTGSQRAARPFSFMEYSQDKPMQPRPEVLQRAPSVESIPSQQYLNRPPSPVSPQRSMTRDVSDQHEQTVPTHYDANHDVFTSDNGNGPLRRPFQDPNLLEHPAFRHEGPQIRGADIPTEYYSVQRPREEIRLPRQQTTEYQLEGVGPPSVPRTETRSRHSSRSSVFFMNLGNSAKSEGQSKNCPEAQYVESSAKDATASRKKSNRNSVFRTLTGRNGSDRDQTPASVEQPVVQPQNSIPQQPLSASRKNVEKDFVSSGTSGKVRNKLQRASTSGAPEKSVGKKNRFSAIGVSSFETLTKYLC